MRSKLKVVRDDRVSEFHPQGFMHYSASFLSASRYFRMTRSLASFLSMNSSSYAVRCAPKGVSERQIVSPFSTLRRAIISLGRMMPAELPMAIILVVVAMRSLLDG